MVNPKTTRRIVKFNGGLGNQMFQYAFACALADVYQEEVVFDFSYFADVKRNSQVTTRVFELDVFNLICKSVQKSELTCVVKPEFNSKLKNSLAKKIPQLFGVNYFREKNNSYYDRKMFFNPNYVYYEGYFQNEKYFAWLRKKLLNDFSLKVELDEKNQKILDKINSTESVSIHVRRGDYVTLDYVNKIHGICPLSYYEQAVDFITDNVKSPHFFLFSDDVQWVIENLKIKYPFTVVDFNQGKGWFDLNLMKSCKHNIIANSSFSWWGAWLNKNDDKIVIAPKHWTVKKQHNDIMPDSWLRF